MARQGCPVVHLDYLPGETCRASDRPETSESSWPGFKPAPRPQASPLDAEVSRTEYNLVRLVSSYAMVTLRGTNQICVRFAILYTYMTSMKPHTKESIHEDLCLTLHSSSVETSSLDGINTSLNHKTDNFGKIKFVNLTFRSV